jgi:hypothetical protein
MWAGTRIHSGGGGGGGHKDEDTLFLQSFGFSFELFEADWPAMAEAYNKTKVWAALKGDQTPIDDLVNKMYPAEGY